MDLGVEVSGAKKEEKEKTRRHFLFGDVVGLVFFQIDLSSLSPRRVSPRRRFFEVTVKTKGHKSSAALRRSKWKLSGWELNRA